MRTICAAVGAGRLDGGQQQRLKRSSVFITRAGGMGGPAALMLAMAGVGRVVIAHGGPLVSADLNRQVLGAEEHLGEPRAKHFAARLRAMNRFVTVEAVDHEPDDREALAWAQAVRSVALLCPKFCGASAAESGGGRVRQAPDRCGPVGNDRHADGAGPRPHALSAVRLSGAASVRGAVSGRGRDQLHHRCPGRARVHQDPRRCRQADVGTPVELRWMARSSHAKYTCAAIRIVRVVATCHS